MVAHRKTKYDRQYGAYLVGESMSSISKRLGLARSAVGRAFRRRGYKKRSAWITNEADRELIRILAETNDHSRQQLADAFGYKSYVSITEIINEHNYV